MALIGKLVDKLLTKGSITLKREQWTLPADLPFGDSRLIPLNAGETINWKMA